MNATLWIGSLRRHYRRGVRWGILAALVGPGLLLLLFLASTLPVSGNPQGGVVRQGNATFNTQGSQLNITTSGRTFIDWGSFNIGVGETTRFFQPSSSSVIWNRINDGNPSQILGNLNANGLIVLQNQAGFFVGGQAAISVGGGLVMTTAPTFPSDFMDGGMWTFNGPPPAANIINYGQISTAPGGSVYLIARGIENHGSITAPEGKVGLYAGKQVLLSERPDGLGLNAQVTLPEGSVDNSGRIIADAGMIALHAQVVNQGGLVQANSIRENNGIIELVASESLNLKETSVISAKGDSLGTSSGGEVLLKSDRHFVDATASSISVVGGLQGGNGGRLEISATEMTAIQSRVDGSASAGFSRGSLILDPLDIILESGGSPGTSGTVNQGDPPTAGALVLDPASFSSFSQITLQAMRNVTLNSAWTLADSIDPSSHLLLQAGNDIILNGAASISAGKNWSVSLIAGADFKSPTTVTRGIGGIYLNDYSTVEAQNGHLSLVAGKEVLVSQGAIRTIGGGSIEVTALSGDINSGTDPIGYSFRLSGLGYVPAGSALGGISTAAGGDVTITAGGNVTSYLPSGMDSSHTDGGSGAFGREAGVVTVTAGGNVYGHFVAANSQRNGQVVASTITSLHGSIGEYGNPVALSLMTGGWQLNAPGGDVWLQEVRNPNGVFNARGSYTAPWRHLFDYDPHAFVDIRAGDSVHLDGGLLPRLSEVENVPVLYPPSLFITAGSGGVILGSDLTLFPSPFGQMNIKTTDGGSLQSDQAGVTRVLSLSDSARNRWIQTGDFSVGEHAAIPVQAANPDPVILDISGNVRDLNLVMPKKTELTVGGDMDNSAFSAQNLHPGDVSAITVAGRIWNRGDWTFVDVNLPLPSARFPGDHPTYLQVLLDAVQPSGNPLFPPNLYYDPERHQLAFNGRMDYALQQLLLGSFQVKTYGPDGQPLRDLQGNYLTKTVTSGIPAEVIRALYTSSQDVPAHSDTGYLISGPGQLHINAGSLDLGVTAGVLSLGPAYNQNLAKLSGGASSADLIIRLAGDLEMFSSTISSIGGGVIDIFAGGKINVGSQQILGTTDYPRGIFTSGHSDVSVVAVGDINVQGSRIAAYNGGDIFVRSEQGDVNAGTGGSQQVRVTELFVDPVTKAVTLKNQPIAGSGIMALTLPDAPLNETVGNITIETPRGDITASQGGVVQDALNGNRSLSPTVTLTAGTRDASGAILYAGNIDAGGSGVIGVNTKLNAAGDIKGLVVARGDSFINAAANVSGTFFAAGTANFNAGGTVSGTVIAGQGINAGSGGFNATAFSQNVTVGGAKGESALASSASAGTTSQSASQSAQQDSVKQVALAQASSDDDVRKNLKRPTLVKRTGRVTVILPAAQ
jgi:filamentous hemagglutinin family protein